MEDLKYLNGQGPAPFHLIRKVPFSVSAHKGKLLYCHLDEGASYLQREEIEERREKAQKGEERKEKRKEKREKRKAKREEKKEEKRRRKRREERRE
jgi:hypothetical protein